MKEMPNKMCPLCRATIDNQAKNYALLEIIERSKDYEALFKIFLVGESGVGKTSVLKAFLGGKFDL